MTPPISRRHVLGALALSTLPGASAWASAAWPTRPIRMVIPAPPGGGTDVLGRMLADRLSASLGQPVIADNKAGANGLLASEMVANATPDGYVLLFSYTAAMVINPGLFTRAPDPLKDFEPVAQVGSIGNVLLASPDLPANNLAELVAYAKQQPATMSYGSWGIGSGGHLTMESFLHRANLSMVMVPYKGVPNVVTDLLAGVIKIGWGDISSTVNQVKAGKLKALAVSGPNRVPQFPDVGTMGEQGFPFDATSWWGLFAPAKTPADIVQKLNTEVVRAVSSKEFRERLRALNQPDSPTPDVRGFRRRVADDQKVWLGILKIWASSPNEKSNMTTQIELNTSLHEGPTVGELYRSAFRAFGDREALVGGDVRMSYAELAAQVHRLVRCFDEAGLKPQDSLVLLGTNRPACVSVQIAAHMAGLVYTPLHPLGSEEDHSFILRDLGAQALVVDPTRHADRGRILARQAVAPRVFTLGPADFGIDLTAAAAGYDDSETELRGRPNDVLRIMFSGGSTGRSKGIVHVHRTAITTTTQQLATWEWPDRVRYLATTPISHAAGALILTTFLQGGTVFLLDKYTPEACLAMIAREKINTTFMVPTQIYGLLDSPELKRHALGSLELLLYGAAPMTPARLRQALETLGPVFAQVYAQVEAPMTVCYLRRDEHDLSHPERLASCGRVVPGNQLKLLDEQLREVPEGEIGEVCLRGPLIMQGYHNRPEETAKTLAGDWLHTGDMGRMDAHGFVYLVDRAKDMIISGGFNVYSTEVEACLAQHPAVAQSAVIGVPHDKWGEAVMGVVVLHPGQDVEAEALMTFVTQRKGAVNTPKFIEFVKALPLTSLGKVDKKNLRSHYWSGQERQIS